jgi:hypothetical protein
MNSIKPLAIIIAILIVSLFTGLMTVTAFTEKVKEYSIDENTANDQCMIQDREIWDLREGILYEITIDDLDDFLKGKALENISKNEINKLKWNQKIHNWLKSFYTSDDSYIVTIQKM